MSEVALEDRHLNSDDEANPDQSAESEFVPQGTNALVCPHCSQAITLTEMPANGLVECPVCGAQFFAFADPADAEEEARAEAEAEADRSRREVELSEMHMRQVSTLLRSMARTRSYFIVGAWGCIGTALQLAWSAAWSVHGIFTARAVGQRVGVMAYSIAAAEIAAIAGLLLGSRYFFRRARRIEQELRETKMKDPEMPPDLSTLGSNTEQWRALEEMHEGSK